MEGAAPHLLYHLFQRTLSVCVCVGGGGRGAPTPLWSRAGAFRSGDSVLQLKAENTTRDFTRVKEEMTAWGQGLILSAKSLSVESEAGRKSGLVIWPKSV